jgi:hypothetical protein
MRRSKTISVSKVIDAANHMLEESVPEYAAQREGVVALLECILFDTGNYRGYLVADDDATRRNYYQES